MCVEFVIEIQHSICIKRSACNI